MINKSCQKGKIIDKTRNYCNVYFIHIYYEFITILFIYCTHTHTYAHISNQFIQFGTTLLRGFRTQFQEIKKHYQNSAIKSSMIQIFM